MSFGTNTQAHGNYGVLSHGSLYPVGTTLDVVFGSDSVVLATKRFSWDSEESIYTELEIGWGAEAKVDTGLTIPFDAVQYVANSLTCVYESVGVVSPHNPNSAFCVRPVKREVEVCPPKIVCKCENI